MRWGMLGSAGGQYFAKAMMPRKVFLEQFDGDAAVHG